MLELLPALLVKKPALFIDADALPDDLDAAVRALRRNQTPAPFRGIEGPALLKWLPLVGHKDKLPSQLTTFRLQQDDLALFARLQRELGGCRSTILRRALRALASKQGVDREP